MKKIAIAIAGAGSRGLITNACGLGKFADGPEIVDDQAGMMKKSRQGGNSVTYEKLNSTQDGDIPALLAAYRSPETARFISLDEENYWRYVTTADGVSFFKAFEQGRLAAAVHCELQERTMYMDIMVLPQWRRCGIGTQVMQDVLQGVLLQDFDQIEVSIDEANTASIRLFEKMGFLFMSQTDELRNYLYRRA